MPRRSRILGLIAALGLPTWMPARAAGWIQDGIGLGDRGLAVNDAGALYRFKNGVSLGLEHMIYTLTAMPLPANALKMRLARGRDGRTWGLRPVLYPAASGASAIGSEVFYAAPIGSDEDTLTWIGFNAGAVRQDAPFFMEDGSAPRRTFGEYLIEGQLLQSYFQIFQLGLIVDGFLYDTPFAGVLSTGSLYNQADLASLSSLRPLTRMPQAAGTLQFVRKGDPGIETHFFVNYSYILYAGAQGAAHSILAGLDLKLSNRWRLDLSEHLLSERGDALLKTTGALLRCGF